MHNVFSLPQHAAWMDFTTLLPQCVASERVPLIPIVNNWAQAITSPSLMGAFHLRSVPHHKLPQFRLLFQGFWWEGAEEKLISSESLQELIPSSDSPFPEIFFTNSSSNYLISLSMQLICSQFDQLRDPLWLLQFNSLSLCKIDLALRHFCTNLSWIFCPLSQKRIISMETRMMIV